MIQSRRARVAAGEERVAARLFIFRDVINNHEDEEEREREGERENGADIPD